MIFAVIALIASLVFPYALIHAVTSKRNKDIWTAVSCISFAVLVGSIVYLGLHVLDTVC